MANTMIEWADKVWNPVTGCTKVSEGCKYCYAERIAKRFWRKGINGDFYRPFTEVRCHHERLEEPLHWKKPARIFVDSMGDLFHKDVPNSFLRQVFWIMQMAPIHTFLILTKRPKRMCEWINNDPAYYLLPNVWLGVSVENQKAADERIPLLLQTPASIRFVSIEPMLEKIHLDNGEYSWISCMSKETDPETEKVCCESFADTGEHYHGIDWVICGGESGSKARPMQYEWAENLLDQCQGAKVPFFFKQWGEWYPVIKGGKPTMMRLGKKKAGRILNGQTWDQYPEVQ